MGKLITDMEDTKRWKLYCRIHEPFKVSYNTCGTVYVNKVSGEKSIASFQCPITLESGDGVVFTLGVPQLKERYLQENFRPITQEFIDELKEGKEANVVPNRVLLYRLFHAASAVYGLNCPNGINSSFRNVGDGDYIIRKATGGRDDVISSYTKSRFYECVEDSSDDS